MKELITALIKAKSQFKPIKKDASNPFFKSKYLTLDGLLDAVEESLLANGLVLVQTLDGNRLVTTLWHESGQSLQGSHPLPEISDPQKFGSAITYARRYSISAILNVVADEDDDGNSASQSKSMPVATTQAAKPATPNTPPAGWKPSYK